MIKAIIIDDEIHCLDTLGILLEDYCKDVQVEMQCISAAEGLIAIEKFKPDLVFLDIEMPVMNGFDLLAKFEKIKFFVIFTTSYNQYAIKAIRFSALDYLLKPIDPKELVIAIEKIKKQKYKPSVEQFEMMNDHLLHKQNGFQNIAVPTLEGFEMIPAVDLVRCEAEDNYTHLFLKNGKKITACRTLKEMEEHLKDFSFFLRVHHSYLINLNEIAKYIRGEGGYLVMNDGATVNVSRSRKEALMLVFERGK